MEVPNGLTENFSILVNQEETELLLVNTLVENKKIQTTKKKLLLKSDIQLSCRMDKV